MSRQHAVVFLKTIFFVFNFFFLIDLDFRLARRTVMIRARACANSKSIRQYNHIDRFIVCYTIVRTAYLPMVFFIVFFFTYYRYYAPGLHKKDYAIRVRLEGISFVRLSIFYHYHRRTKTITETITIRSRPLEIKRYFVGVFFFFFFPLLPCFQCPATIHYSKKKKLLVS